MSSSAHALEAAAQKVFTERGYAGAHVGAIARRAGVSIATFYVHLDSKALAYRRVMGEAPPVDGAAGPRSARGKKTRAALVAAAQRCIVRDGFSAARISDIAKAARASVASFYTYFPSKRAVFEAVVAAVGNDLRTRSASADQAQRRTGSIPSRIRRVIEHYFDTYGVYAPLVLRIDEAVSVYPDLMPMRLAVHHGFAERIARSLARWQDDGLADRGLDAQHAGDALAAMVGHAARVWLTFGQPHDRRVAVDTLTRLWVQAIKVG